MKKILILALVLFSTMMLHATDFPKDTLWVGYVPYVINNAMFSRDESKVYVNTAIGFSILDAKTGKTVEEVKGLGNIGRESADGSFFMNFHPTDIRIKEGNVEKYDSKTRQLIWKCPKREKDSLITAAFSENGKFILLIYSGIYIEIFNSESQTLVKRLQVNFGFTENGFAIDNTGEKLILSVPTSFKGKEGTASYLMDINKSADLYQIYFYTDPSSSLRSAMFSTHNNYAIAKYSDTITVLDLKTMKSFEYIPSGGNYGSRVGIMSPDEKLLISGGVKKGCVEIYDIGIKKIVYSSSQIGVGNSPNSADINTTNNYLVMHAGGPGTIVAIDLSKTWTEVPIENNNEILYPNPTTGQLQAELTISIPTQIYSSIIDISGRTVKNTNLGFYETGNIKIPINVATISKGTYTITFQGNNLNKYFKFIKE